MDEVAAAFTETWVDPGPAGPRPTVLLHNDFHPGNMVFTAPVGTLTGIWDFSCVRFGDPTLDLHYLDHPRLDLLRRVAEGYQERTGRTVDVPAAALANRMERVCDAVETRREDWLAEALARGTRS